MRSGTSILIFWLPLAAAWVMMASEGPFVAAVIARLDDPTFNLAAYGVAFAFAILVEAPVIMLMSASTALVEDAESYRRLRNFTTVLIALVSGLLVFVLVPPVYSFLIHGILGLPAEVAHLTYGALWILLPWPGAIGYRRFVQGVLIRSGRTQLVALGTVVRLSSMAATALALYRGSSLPGAWVGAAALTVGVCGEAAAARLMAIRTIREVLRDDTWNAAVAPPMGYRGIARFYYPLALTSMIGLTVQPLLTFFMGRAPSPIRVTGGLSSRACPLVLVPVGGAELPGGGLGPHGQPPSALSRARPVRPLAGHGQLSPPSPWLLSLPSPRCGSKRSRG